MKQNSLAVALMVLAILSFSTTQSETRLTANTVATAVATAAGEGIQRAALGESIGCILFSRPFEKENFIISAAMLTGFNLVDKLMEPRSLEFSKNFAFKCLCGLACGLSFGLTVSILYYTLATLFSKKNPEHKAKVTQKSETSLDPVEVAYFNSLLKKPKIKTT